MSELFDEVDEDVRRDQLKKLWDQYSIYIVAGALLIIASVGGWRGYQYLEAKKAAEAGAAFDKASELSEQMCPVTASAAARNKQSQTLGVQSCLPFGGVIQQALCQGQHRSGKIGIGAIPYERQVVKHVTMLRVSGRSDR